MYFTRRSSEIAPNLLNMKIIVLVLYFVGVVVIADAKAVCNLPNGGSLLSPDGKYIPGKVGPKKPLF